jgi:hypothetical protein
VLLGLCGKLKAKVPRYAKDAFRADRLFRCTDRAEEREERRGTSEKHVGIVFPRKADSSVYLNVQLRTPQRSGQGDSHCNIAG